MESGRYSCFGRVEAVRLHGVNQPPCSCRAGRRIPRGSRTSTGRTSRSRRRSRRVPRSAGRRRCRGPRSGGSPSGADAAGSGSGSGCGCGGGAVSGLGPFSCPVSRPVSREEMRHPLNEPDFRYDRVSNAGQRRFVRRRRVVCRVVSGGGAARRWYPRSRRPRVAGSEEHRVRSFHAVDRRAPASPGSFWSDAQAARSRIAGVGLPLKQPFGFQLADDLRGHLDVGPRLPGQFELVGEFAVVVQPPGAGEEDELHMRQAEGGKDGGDLPLPAERGVPQPESGRLEARTRR